MAIYRTGLLQSSCQSFTLKNIIELMKTDLNQLQLVYRSCALYPLIPTHNGCNFTPWTIKNSWELREICQTTFWCEYFDVIWAAVTVLFIPCATKMLGTIGHYPRQRNNIHKHLYHVYLIHLTALTSCNYKLQTTTWNTMYFCFGHISVRSW